MIPEENLPEPQEAVGPEAKPDEVQETAEPQEEVSAEDLLPDEEAAPAANVADAQLKAVLEAIIYITDEPLTLDQICTAIEQPRERVVAALEQLASDYEKDDRGLSIREIAGGFKMTTKPEHHEDVRRFVKNLNPPLKLSLPALETLAVIAYKQPVTAPEVGEIRGVDSAGVLGSLIGRKLITTAGRKQVVGRPILYKTTKEFLLRFGLKDISELPSMEEFEKMAALELSEPEDAGDVPADNPGLFAEAPHETQANESQDAESPSFAVATNHSA